MHPPTSNADVATKSQEPDAARNTVQTNETDPQTDAQIPVKRGRGRPKGSKNKRKTQPAAHQPPVDPATKRKRGRPPKEETGEPKPKRRRGRPPKVPVQSDATADTAEPRRKKA